ncbi:Testis-expressed sequence 2 protein [Senna tora]|uniref:Testis-expressed sequence 2 protein n=1 Tax=Senna tora TaxID=362788 RepID=A0A834WGS8_9FABA|nr:Testis-expressed sequence 2 protein [Senna tora]
MCVGVVSSIGKRTIVAAEALGVFFIVRWLGARTKSREAKTSSERHAGAVELDPLQSLSFAENKQGVVWVLESDKIPEISLDKPLKETKRRKPEIFELKGCVVEAVSATNLSSRKWAKRFPIKLESKSSAIYNGRKSIYLYLETSWDKEAWCKALRLASCDQEDTVKWFAQLHKEFHSYLASLNAEYHTFLKPTVGSSIEAVNKASKPDGGSSRVHQFLKKIAKKSSRVGLDNKSTWTSLSGREERKNTEKLRASQDAVLAANFMKNASTARHLKLPTEDNAPLLSPTLSHSGSHSHISASSDVDLDEKLGIDEGTLCWNLLISRLFFDAKSNTQLKRSIQARIQLLILTGNGSISKVYLYYTFTASWLRSSRTFSNMRIPSYVGEIICTGINTGTLPPCIVGMRVLPMEMSEVWAFEVDIEYSGGAVLEIETRLEVGELDLPPEIENSNLDSSSDDVSSDLLESFEDLGMHLNLSEGTSDLQDTKEDCEENTGVSKSAKSTPSSSTHGSRWKSIIKSIAKQVSQLCSFQSDCAAQSSIGPNLFAQVPLSLAIRIASLRGTLRLHIKPPPSDQLWYGFTSMPDIDFNLESSVGEHKITNGRFALLLVNRLKNSYIPQVSVRMCKVGFFCGNAQGKFILAPAAMVRETIVLPNCESVCLSWMQAEKNDWVPRDVAPFRWVSQESRKETSTSNDAAANQPPVSAKSSGDGPEHKKQKLKSSESSQEPNRKSADSVTLPSCSTETLRSSRSLDDLKSPLLGNDKPQEIIEHNDMGDTSDCQQTRELEKENNSIVELDDTKPKKMGKRERMLDLRKKMTEKFEEKRRHIEEKGRNIVDKYIPR